MRKQFFALVILLAVWSVGAHSEPAALADAAACRLQDDRECLEILETCAAAAPERETAAKELYAVLVNGDVSTLHNGNVERAYEVLRTLGVPDDRIYILSNSNPRPAADAGRLPLVTAEATTINLAGVLSYLAGEVDENDCLLLYTTGHGIRKRGQSALMLNDGPMLEKDLVRRLKPVQAAVTAVIMDQCFSGGFADAFEKARMNVVAMTDTDSHHETYCEYFASAFWYGLVEPAADLDGDGRITLSESYEVAMAIHQMALAETPERTQGQLLIRKDGAIPAVSVADNSVTWAVDREEPEEAAPARSLLAQATTDAAELRLRRSLPDRFRLGHRNH